MSKMPFHFTQESADDNSYATAWWESELRECILIYADVIDARAVTRQLQSLHCVHCEISISNRKLVRWPFVKSEASKCLLTFLILTSQNAR